MARPTQAAPADTSRYLPLLVLLFAGSGCSALIYETVWYQLLQLAIGSTAVSLGCLLATFMGGLCIGSMWFPRLRLAGHHPLLIYGYLELGIAASALLVHLLLPLVNMAYIAGAEHGMPGFLLRGFLSAICLLPPTVLMGASLPAIVRWLKSTPNGVSWYGLLYGGNTAGAVFGCLLAGFYLLRIYNMSIATYAAAALNAAVALASFALAAHTPAEASVPETGARAGEAGAAKAALDDGDGIPRWTIYAAIGLSGATALGAEVVWTRLLGMLLGLTVYIFSIILAVFLTGLALGSGLGSMLLRSVRPRLALA
ncbi:MAG: SAM-dependent methyltransferase, partial [Nevskiales bacterium]